MIWMPGIPAKFYLEANRLVIYGIFFCLSCTWYALILSVSYSNSFPFFSGIFSDSSSPLSSLRNVASDGLNLTNLSSSPYKSKTVTVNFSTSNFKLEESKNSKM